MGSIQVGTAVVDITPPAGHPLMGNFRDDYLARGTHDPLMAKAAVFADSRGTKAAVLAIDLCMVDRGNVALLREVIAGECDVPPENVLVHATHTHSAPAANDRYLYGLDFAPYRAGAEALLVRAASAVKLANDDLADASFRIGRSQEHRLSFNRRLRRKDGSTQMNWEALAAGFDAEAIDRAWGPTDPELLCLVVERPNRQAAAIVNFGLHPAILAGDNWLYSADYPGVLATVMERIHGDGFTTLFLNGCSGDINHCDYRQPAQGRGVAMVERVGHMLAVAASEAVRKAAPAPIESIEVMRQPVKLTRMPISDEERRRCQAIVDEATRQPLSGQVDGLPEAFFADIRLAMYERQREIDEVELIAIRLGEVALIGLPGENFCETGLTIKHRSPFRATMVAGLCGDAIGYLPTRESFSQGGYEVTVGSTLYEPGAAELIAESALALLKRLGST